MSTLGGWCRRLLVQILLPPGFFLPICGFGAFIYVSTLFHCSKRVFILGPSHYVKMDYCALSLAEVYQNPIMDLEIDQKGTFCEIEHDECSMIHWPSC
jgi:AmmeMemoRadiSam system protein B